eukprot:gnl/Chilomastix_caulleri/2761.p1 GENE.gnl/Chilomastix_caulleri/2761~~gnl/Chilomastix_caulleri/2761.p1  ORF type:complete len:171 (-),score=32.99 gnl/Chilomastix_caulleri/2761:10-522(-)
MPRPISRSPTKTRNNLREEQIQISRIRSKKELQGPLVIEMHEMMETGVNEGDREHDNQNQLPSLVSPDSHTSQLGFNHDESQFVTSPTTIYRLTPREFKTPLPPSTPRGSLQSPISPGGSMKSELKPRTISICLNLPHPQLQPYPRFQSGRPCIYPRRYQIINRRINNTK